MKIMSKRLTPTAIATAVLLLANNAFAQQAAAQDAEATQANTLDKVQVTGSRISMKQAQISGVGPVTVIDAEAIQRSGAISAETLLQRLPVPARRCA